MRERAIHKNLLQQLDIQESESMLSNQRQNIVADNMPFTCSFIFRVCVLCFYITICKEFFHSCISLFNFLYSETPQVRKSESINVLETSTIVCNFTDFVLYFSVFSGLPISIINLGNTAQTEYKQNIAATRSTSKQYKNVIGSFR